MSTGFHKVKIFGERNTSTNAMKKLVQANSSCRTLPAVVSELPQSQTLNLKMMPPKKAGVLVQEAFIDKMFQGRRPRQSWKHTATNFKKISDFEGVFTIIMVRDPASWLQALKRRPYHMLQRMPEDLGKFVVHKWRTAGRERLDRAVMTPATLWNTKMACYSDFIEQLKTAGHAHLIIHFEDFAMDQAAVFEKIRPYLQGVPEEITLIESSTKDSHKDREYYRRYYGNKEWLQKIEPEALEVINANIDWDIAARFGYAPHQPSGT